MELADDITTIFTHPVLSNEVGDVTFVTSHDVAVVSIKCSADSALVYRASLYPDKEGVCTAYQVGDVIEQWMEQKGLSFCSFVFKDEKSDASASFSVLLCRFIKSIGAENYQSLAVKPLLSCRYNVMPKSGMCRFYFIPQSNADAQKVSVVVSGITFDGLKAEKSIELSATLKDNKICCIEISADDLLSLINGSLSAEEEFSYINWVHICKYSTGQLEASFYISDDPDLVGFGFINRFGLYESIWLHSEILPDFKIESEIAIIGHKSVQFDVESSMSVKVEASNIAHAEWPRVVQFLASKKIFQDSTGRRILLSDVSQEPCRTYDSLGSLKFTYCYDDDRVIL